MVGWEIWFCQFTQAVVVTSVPAGCRFSFSDLEGDG